MKQLIVGCEIHTMGNKCYSVTGSPFFQKNAYLIIVYNSINIYNNLLLYIYYFLFLGLYFVRFSPKKVTWLPFQATTLLFFDTIPLAVIKAISLNLSPPQKKHHKLEVTQFLEIAYISAILLGRNSRGYGS